MIGKDKWNETEYKLKVRDKCDGIFWDKKSNSYYCRGLDPYCPWLMYNTRILVQELDTDNKPVDKLYFCCELGFYNERRFNKQTTLDSLIEVKNE